MITAEATLGATRTPPISPSIRILVAGISTTANCGVRDHARILSETLERNGAQVTTTWLEQSAGSFGVAKLSRELWLQRKLNRHETLIVHYSVFAYARRGIPIGVPLLALALRCLGTPVVLFAHEFAYPWGTRGWRGAIQAATQRAALLPLVGACDAVVVTTEDRLRWLETRRWLPRRAVVCAPVFSNIRPNPSRVLPQEIPGRIGVFSFGAEGLEAKLVTAAVAEVARERPGAHLVLIGAPGPQSAAGQRWQQAATNVQCPLTFTGMASEAETSERLSTCQLIVFPDPAGPSSRKTSLAAALTHARAVIALNGPQSWSELLAASAIVIVEPRLQPLAAALENLLADDVARSAIARKALAFAKDHLTTENAAATILDVSLAARANRTKRVS